MGPDTENNSWTWKVATDTVSSIQGAAHYRGACLIDARFTFQPGGAVLLARGLSVEALTKEQLDMIVEWRVCDVQPVVIAPISKSDFERQTRLAHELGEGIDAAGEEARRKEHIREELARANAGLDRAISNIVNHPERREPKGISSAEASKYPHYFKDVRHLNYVDIYRLLDLFEITDQPVAHAIKKLMAAGKRGAKDADKDISEAIDCLLRRKTMNREDTRRNE